MGLLPFGLEWSVVYRSASYICSDSKSWMTINYWNYGQGLSHMWYYEAPSEMWSMRWHHLDLQILCTLNRGIKGTKKIKRTSCGKL